MSWQDKAMAATSGTQLGAIMAAALGREIPAPYFSGKASVTSDGFVMCDFTRYNGDYKMGAFVGSLSDLERNVSGLAKHLKLSAEECAEYADAMASWIGSDYSPGAKHRLRKAIGA